MGHKQNLVMLIFFICVSKVSFCQDAVPLMLQDNWRFQSSSKVSDSGATLSLASYDDSSWFQTSVPTTVLAALVHNGVYPDPYYGENLKHIPGYQSGRWLVMPQESPFRSSWWFRKTFRIPASFRGRNLSLRVDGINYRANIWLNGEQIADKENTVGMFRRFQFDITSVVKFDVENCLALEIFPPGLLPEAEYRTKQLEATTGWDDHNPQPPDANMGIWQPVYIKSTGPLELKHPYVYSELSIPDLAKAKLTASVCVANKTGQRVEGVISGSIGKITFNKAVFLEPFETRWVKWDPDQFTQLIIENPRVWWPHPLGTQELYELRLVADSKGTVSDTCQLFFGIRNITSELNEENWRQFYVNGRKVLIRGAAWMTPDMLLRLEKRRYEALVRYAREAHLNMFRIEGFSIRETGDFFDLCDQYGIMVTQQLFGRSIPDESLAIACVEDTILRLRNHPSLVHFIGHDEAFPTPSLDAAYRELIQKYAPDRSYQPHSGAFRVEDRVETGGTRTGTRELWTYAGPHHYYERKEDGAWGFAQSGGIGGIVAPYDSVRRFTPEDQLWPIWTDALSFHTVIQGGNFFDTVIQMLNARYGHSQNLEEFCQKAQTLNYECARAMFEAYGRNKYSATGITTWKYNAAWPAFMTWQFVDWYLNPTGAYYGAQKACQPLHVQYAYDDGAVYVVNSFYQAFKNLKVTSTLFDFQMRVLWKESATVDIEADSVQRVHVVARPNDISDVYFLYLQLENEQGEKIDSNFYWLSVTKDVRGEVVDDWVNFSVKPQSVANFLPLSQLPEAHLEVKPTFFHSGKETHVKVSIKNVSSHLAFQIRLAVLTGENGNEVTPIFWRENLVQILPEYEQEMTAFFYTGDLENYSPVLQVSGWNIKKMLIPVSLD